MLIIWEGELESGSEGGAWVDKISWMEQGEAKCKMCTQTEGDKHNRKDSEPSGPDVTSENHAH